MPGTSKIESAEYADLSGVLRWFISLRWIASAGVTAAILVGRYLADYRLPYPWLWAVTGLLIACNTAYSVYFIVVKKRVLSRVSMSRFFHLQTIFDYLYLFLLVYLTGYVFNPFVYFFVFHVMMTSFIFPTRIVSAYVLFIVAVFALVSLGVITGVLASFAPFTGAGVIDGAAEGREIALRTFAVVMTLGIVAYLITSIKARIEERGQRVELELDRYKSLDKAKSNFILQVTHELRGPLAALKGYHEMILKGITGTIAEKTRDTLSRADRRTRNLLNIIDEMIDFAYMKSEAEIEYAPAELALREILAYQADLYATMAREKSIRVYLSAGRELTMRANRDLLNIILGNLVTNAIRYSPNGARIVLSAQLEGSEIHLMVQDTGMGIEPEELESVFEEFYRSQRAREIERDGTGLGLSIVQKAVNLLGGRISVYSEIDRGTSFHIYLPKSGKPE